MHSTRQAALATSCHPSSSIPMSQHSGQFRFNAMPRIDVKSELDVKRFTRMVSELLAKVPSEHLAGLGVVRIVDVIPRQRNEIARGLYSPAGPGRPEASVDIAIETILDEVPRWVRGLRLIQKLLLAQVLYHEIGHHHHWRMRHAIKRDQREVAAEAYRKQQLSRATADWRRRFWPIIRPLRFVVRKSLQLIDSRVRPRNPTSAGDSGKPKRGNR